MSADEDIKEGGRYLGSKDFFERSFGLVKFGFIVFSSLYGHALLYGSEVDKQVDTSALGLRGTMRQTKGAIAEELIIGGVVLCGLSLCMFGGAWNDKELGMVTALSGYALSMSDTGETLILSRLILPDLKGEFSINNATCPEIVTSPLDLVVVTSLLCSMVFHVYARQSGVSLGVIIVAGVIFASALRDSLIVGELVMIALVPVGGACLGLFCVAAIEGDADNPENELDDKHVVAAMQLFGAVAFLVLGYVVQFDPEKVCYISEIFYIFAGILLVQGSVQFALDYYYPLPEKENDEGGETTVVTQPTQPIQPTTQTVDGVEVLEYSKV